MEKRTEKWFPVETERLLLREFRAADETDVQEYACDPEVVRYEHWGPNTLEMTRAFLGGILNEQERWPRESVTLAMELKAEKKLVGTIRFAIQKPEYRTADFGYSMNRRYWNRGLATEAARAILEVAFGKLGMHRVWATCDVRNAASYRVMEKLGMRREGEFRKDALEKGNWRDTYLYAVLEEEWRSVRQP